ncbi:hypothetical protein BSL78_21403 [Apostichopus japonicus]|uniref:Peptidase aspartic putative domain-containing protein n=1 Tax=Stichopus japonicus TaxID=307972 RepID=A0A2G8K189_STIJA|nr:hypothetical protein BSL78_21403 [Apostichopus japonicus]
MRARFLQDQTSGFNTRQRILTEKGFQYQLGQKEQRFRGIISKWRKHVLKIECLLSERSNLVDIKAERDVLLETMADLSVYIEVDNLLSTVDQMGSKYSIFEAIEIEHCNLIKRVSEYIHSVTSQGSCSKSSVSAKSHSTTKDEIVTTIAAHEAKLKQIEMKAKFEVQQLQLRAKHEAELQRSELAIAKDALEGYFLVPSDSTYIEVRKLLDDRYGNNLAIADAFRSKLEGWPNIQPNDGLALRKFADFLGQCEFAMKLVKGRLSFLNDSWENRKLLDKLPDWLVKRWGRVLSEWDDFPPFGKTVCSSSKSIGIQTEAINTGLSHVSGLRDITMNSLILPVYVSHVDAPQREVLVYALLDTQSDSTFITDKTCELLNVEGSKTLLSLSTLSSKNQLVDSSRIGGLSVRGHREGTKVPLPVSYTRCSIHANRSHIPTPGTARQWPHLKRIANHLMPLEQCEIGLLIGYNCPKALMPIEVISPPDNGPYAERTNLGWGIVGIINPRELSVDKCDPVGVSHFIVTPRPTSEFDSILPRDGAKICFKCNIREVEPTQVAGLMELEFNERNFESAYSREDKKFLNILKEGVCQLSDGHYQLPLPMKLSQIFPNVWLSIV